LSKFLSKVNRDPICEVLTPRREDYACEASYVTACDKFGTSLREARACQRDIRMSLQKLVGRSSPRGLSIPRIDLVVEALLQEVREDLNIPDGRDELRALFKRGGK